MFTNSRSWNDGNTCHGCLNDVSRKDLSYPHKLHPPLGCRNVQRCCHRRWCRGYRGPASFPGPSTCPPHTPHTACRGPTHSLAARRGLPGTWCRAHTAVTGCSCSSHTCKCTWRRWSRCTAFSWPGVPCISCRADTYLCGWSFLRTFHLRRQKKKVLKNLLELRLLYSKLRVSYNELKWHRCFIYPKEILEQSDLQRMQSRLYVLWKWISTG